MKGYIAKRTEWNMEVPRRDMTVGTTFPNHKNHLMEKGLVNPN